MEQVTTNYIHNVVYLLQIQCHMYACGYIWYKFTCIHSYAHVIDMLNKNTLGVKSAGPIKSSIVRMCDQKIFFNYLNYNSYSVFSQL